MDHNITMEIKGDSYFSELGKSKFMPAVIPGCVHTDLMANNVIGDPFFRKNELELQWIDKTDWEYILEFEIGGGILDKKNKRLTFKGIDTYADVYLNGSLLLETDNMFREWKAGCEENLDKKNSLRFVFHSPVNEGLKKLEELGFQPPAVNDLSEIGGLEDKKVSPFVRKAPYHFGWDWGPRLVTSGVWRPIFIEAWDDLKIEDIFYHVKTLDKKNAVISAEFEILASEKMKVTVVITDQAYGTVLKTTDAELIEGLNKIGCDFRIDDPKLWWSNGLGEPYLYEFKISVQVDGISVEEKTESFGVRTLKLMRKKDGNGTGFYFELNDVPVFMKGANYIPNDIFPSRVTRERYESTVQSAVDADMNMLRVWGGGIYEDDFFYGLCDRKGILLWHDFMFACSMYPVDAAFEETIRHEFIDNVRRLRNHPSIALWCGNNEIQNAWGEGDINMGWKWKDRFDENQRKFLWESYKKIFYEMIPETIKAFDPARDYWPSSPVSAYDNYSGKVELNSGDVHYWEVWHKKEPFEKYTENIGRFMSEYGFQSFPEFRTVKDFTFPEDRDIESEVMRSHQRSGTGNTLIKQYMDLYYREPKDFEMTLYVSHVLQALGIKSAIEAHRLHMPYCMGTLYWQINDCWPAASWSSIDYYLRWKALHYFVRKAYGNIVILPYLEDDRLAVYTVSDRLAAIEASLEWVLMDFKGTVLDGKKNDLTIKANASEKVLTIEKNGLLKNFDPGKILLYLELKDGKGYIAGNIFYFVRPKELDLARPSIKKKIIEEKDCYRITLETDILAKNVYLQSGEDGFFSDNYFDLIPGMQKEVIFRPFKKENSSADAGESPLEKTLKVISLYDSFQ